jgi:Flp pilus assembly pilin Flp
MSKKGQGMTEYIIIVALIAVAAIGIMVIFGDTVREQFGRITSAMQGVAYKGKSAQQNLNTETQQRGLVNFDEAYKEGAK